MFSHKINESVKYSRSNNHVPREISNTDDIEYQEVFTPKLFVIAMKETIIAFTKDRYISY